MAGQRVRAAGPALMRGSRLAPLLVGLALLAPAAPLSGATLRVIVEAHGSPLPPGVTVEAQQRVALGAEPLGQPLSAEAPGGTASLTLGAGSWSLVAKAPGFWGQPESVALRWDGATAAVTLGLWPTGVLGVSARPAPAGHSRSHDGVI